MIRISTTQFKKMDSNEIQKFCIEYYRTHYQGKSVLNDEKKLSITFSAIGRNKTARNIFTPNRAGILLKLHSIIKTAKFTSFGHPKPNHIKKFNAIGFLNFKNKISVDGVVTQCRITIIINNNGKFQYSLNLNQKK